MEFCQLCHNMMLVKSSPDGKTAEYRCPHCSNAKPIAAGTLLRDRKPADDYAQYARFLTPMLSTDPALPRSAKIECPHCSVTGKVIYVKYDAQGMKYLYHCVACKEFWKRGGDLLKKDTA